MQIRSPLLPGEMLQTCVFSNLLSAWWVVGGPRPLGQRSVMLLFNILPNCFLVIYYKENLKEKNYYTYLLLSIYLYWFSQLGGNLYGLKTILMTMAIWKMLVIWCSVKKDNTKLLQGNCCSYVINMYIDVVDRTMSCRRYPRSIRLVHR